jgi:hypothetical protein
MRWANSVLAHRKQQQLFCEPNNVALTGPEVTEMLRGQLNADPKFGELPFGFGIVVGVTDSRSGENAAAMRQTL